MYIIKCHVSIDWLCGLSNKKQIIGQKHIVTYMTLFTIGEKANLCFETVSYIGDMTNLPLCLHKLYGLITP